MRFWRRRRRALACREAVALMTSYLDGELGARDRDRLEGHLADCPHCSEYLVQLRVTKDALGQIAADELSDDAMDDLIALYRRWQAG